MPSAMGAKVRLSGGIADIVTGAGAGAGPHVAVFDGASGALVGSLFSGTPSFTGGIYVAATAFTHRTPPPGIEDLIAALARACR
jgi:hypothetical protein